MKIATYINRLGEIGGFQENGSVCLFEGQTGTPWRKVKEIEFALDLTAGIPAVKGLLRQTVTQLEGCQVFLVGKLKGAMQVFLEEAGLRVWQSQGSLIEQLNYVALRDTETQWIKQQALAAIKENQKSSGCGSGCGSRTIGERPARVLDEAGNPLPIPAPEPVGNRDEGLYRIDLAAVLKNDPHLNSKEVLVPFLEAAAFKKLEILCDHPPRWLARESEQLHIRTESEVLDENGIGMKVVLVPLN